MIRLIGATALLGAIVSSNALCDVSLRDDEGKKAYEATCASCHETGANGAPSTHNPEEWIGRSSLWESVLLEHANEGYLNMPAKGGNPNLTEYDLGVAAEYMLNISHPDQKSD
ncbi:MAG: c-type cytochrome [Halioglobus sp.]